MEAMLPDDVLVEVLRRLAPHSVAACRWVCKAWRDTIDARLRPLSVRGIFINFTAHSFSEFFSRPSTGPAICGGLDFLPCEGVRIRDHCDGLVLCHDWEREYVVNPATRRWARLPQRPPPPGHMPGLDQTAYLAFDHAASPHYKVFLIPCLPYGELEDDSLLESEWPPASYVMHVFSSMTKRWEKTTFLREGEAAGVLANMASGSDTYRHQDQYRAVYWRSLLYVHCRHGYVMRMSLSNHKYQVIKLPGADGLSETPTHYLGRSMRGVYCALYYHGLQLWHLNESCSQTEWVFEHFVDFNGAARRLHACPEQTGTPWVIQDVNYRKDPDSYCDKHANRDGPVEEKYDWNSEEDNILDTEHVVEDDFHTSSYYEFLGFHPYKEVVFLSSFVERGLAYNWNSSKFQDLGSLYPNEYHSVSMFCTGIDTYFPYTPCWTNDFPGNESESLLQDKRLLRRESESQVEDDPNFTSTDEYELRKLRGHTKRVKDSRAKVRRRHRTGAR
ncbi:hypothetical protein ACQ4PT_058797 [Festuca glaucescens]